MAQEFEPALTPEGEAPRKNTALIIALIVVMLVCCCCFSCAAIYYGIEPFMMALDIPIPW